jgi:hypothetical protein
VQIGGAPLEVPPEPDDPKGPDEVEGLTNEDVVSHEPQLRDADLSDHNETDNDLQTEESLGEGIAGPPPFLTKDGIVLIYNAADDHLVYRTAIAVFDTAVSAGSMCAAVRTLP